MKLVGLMCLECYQDKVRELFRSSEVRIYSEVDIVGHTSESMHTHGWWMGEKDDLPLYSKLYFAVLPEKQAARLMQHIEDMRDVCDPEHPPRAFQVDVEKVVG